MKSKFEKSIVLDAIGVLDVNEDGEYIITIDAKDNVDVYKVNDILSQICGSQVQIKSIAEA